MDEYIVIRTKIGSCASILKGRKIVFSSTIPTVHCTSPPARRSLFLTGSSFRNRSAYGICQHTDQHNARNPCLLPQDVWSISLRHEEERCGRANTSKNHFDPVDPSPADIARNNTGDSSQMDALCATMRS